MDLSLSITAESEWVARERGGLMPSTEQREPKEGGVRTPETTEEHVADL